MRLLGNHVTLTPASDTFSPGTHVEHEMISGNHVTYTHCPLLEVVALVCYKHVVPNHVAYSLVQGLGG